MTTTTSSVLHKYLFLGIFLLISHNLVVRSFSPNYYHTRVTLLPSTIHRTYHSKGFDQLAMTKEDRPAGSFFHQVPENNDDDDGNDEEKKSMMSPPPPPQQQQPAISNDRKNSNMDRDFEDQIASLLRQRKKPPLASQPSTINGMPISKANGFGKVTGINSKSNSSSKPYVAIGQPDTPPTPPINDPTKPEFDDQGYTLYTDKETGKKARVFEALLEYPCEFTMKIVGMNEGTFVQDIVAIVAEACEEEDPAKISHSVRVNGKWTSVTVRAPVKSSEMLYTLYEKVDQDPRVKFKF